MPDHSGKSDTSIFPNKVGRSTFARYGVALLCVAAAFLVRLSLDPLLGSNFAFLTLYGGVAFAVWFGGWRPALLAALIGFFIADYFFVDPRMEFAYRKSTVWAAFIGYLLSCGVIIYLGEAMRRARERVEEQAQHLNAIVEFSGEAILAKDLNGIITSWNKSAQRLFGFEAEEIVGKPVTVLFPPERLHEEDDILKRLRLGEASAHLETVRLTKDGRHIPVYVSVSPLKDAQGRVIGASTIIQDVTERKEAEAQLRQKEAELEAIINRTPFMLTRCSRDLRYLFVSRTYAEMLGRQPEDIAGKPIVEIMGQDGLDTVLPYVERVLRGEQVEYESQVSFKDVGKPFLRVIYSPDRDEQGNVIGWIASIVDITDWKRIEKQREELLGREQEMRQVAEEANRLKDEFLAIMSHELRNPLNVVLGYSEILVRSDQLAQLPPLQRMAEAIKRNAKAQSKLISDLLDLSRLRSGKLELNRQTVSLASSATNAIDTVRADAEAKQIVMSFDPPEESLFVEGDPVRLEQIIWNLLNNSVKFTPAGGEISVHLGQEDAEVVLTVKDNGQGIDDSFLPHVFELFRQADATTSRSQPGMGVGLAVVKQLVDLHNGSITAQSDGLGKGATFTVRLPLSIEMKKELEPVLDITTTLDRFAILVVDDSEDTTEMLSELLKVTGATVASATSGDEALRIIAKRKFDVVLSDISMPEMDGFEFLRRLRQLPGRADVPVLALTGYGRPEDIERAQREGFFSHVTKPFDINALVQILEKIPRASVASFGRIEDSQKERGNERSDGHH